MSDFVRLYVYSAEAAQRLGEVAAWRASYEENCACARAIDQTIWDNYDGYSLKVCAADILQQYGFDRVQWVLANTIRHMVYDGRYSDRNKEWAANSSLPDDVHTEDYCLKVHPGLINLFTNQVREAWDSLQLIPNEHCTGELDYTRQVLVLKPSVLKDAYKRPQFQLFYAQSGFGCDPKALGTQVYGTFLADGEHTHFSRADFWGVLDDRYLPDWAREKVAALTGPTDEEITMGGM